jgi:hypothetical protein
MKASTDEAFSRLLADGYESLAVRKANPGHYWAHRQQGEEARYYWEEEPVSRAEYVATVGEELPQKTLVHLY